MNTKPRLGGVLLALLLALMPAAMTSFHPALPSSEVLEDYLQRIDRERIAEHLARKYRKPGAEVERIVSASYAMTKEFGLSPLLLLAMAQKESSLKPYAMSSYGAKGLLQVVPRFHRDKLVRHGLAEEDLFTVEHNMRIGAAVLTEYLQKADGNLELALVKYSGNARNYARRVALFEQELQLLLMPRAPYVPGRQSKDLRST